MKWLKVQLRNWLIKSLQEDVIELCNAELETLKVDVVPFEQEREMLESAHRVFQEKSFALVLNQLTERQIEHSILQSDSWQRVLFDRATINGIALIKEEFEALDGKFQDMIKPPEEFNKYDVV